MYVIGGLISLPWTCMMDLPVICMFGMTWMNRLCLMPQKSLSQKMSNICLAERIEKFIIYMESWWWVVQFHCIPLFCTFCVCSYKRHTAWLWLLCNRIRIFYFLGALLVSFLILDIMILNLCYQYLTHHALSGIDEMF